MIINHSILKTPLFFFLFCHSTLLYAEKITLPIYPNSEKSVHISSSKLSSQTMLPFASFKTSDSVNQVFTFYKKSLPTFTQENTQGIGYRLAQSSAKIKGIKAYTNIPNVLIMPSIEHKTKHAYTLIQLSYQPIN